jgi:uncharacterized protein YigE (DUF2233 family)
MASIRLFIIASLTAISGGLLYLNELKAPTVAWVKIGEDLELAEVKINANGLIDPQLSLFRTDGKRYRIGVVPANLYGSERATVKKLSLASGAILGINANFFDEFNRPLGLVLNRGNLLNPIHRGGKTLTGIFQVTRGSTQIVYREDFKPDNVIEAVQAGPRLLIKGTPVENLRGMDSYERRSGVCIDNQQRVIIYISSGLIGTTLRELVATLRDPEIGCQDALNLDGGGSAQLYLSRDLPGANPNWRELSMPGSDEVPVMLGLFLQDG